MTSISLNVSVYQEGSVLPLGAPNTYRAEPFVVPGLKWPTPAPANKNGLLIFRCPCGGTHFELMLDRPPRCTTCGECAYGWANWK